MPIKKFKNPLSVLDSLSKKKYSIPIEKLEKDMESEMVR